MDLSVLSDEDLLKLRFCDLPIDLLASEVYPLIEQLYAELAAKQLLLKPPCYFADEWFSPEGETIIAVPFYLGHPRLKRLEQSLMYEVEGASPEWAMKILRHEAGHAMQHAFRLHKNRKLVKVFGKEKKYDPDTYTYRIYSKSYVRNIDDGYAQSHPDEDFAETFAVWLNPSSNWKEHYRGWPALRKLQAMDVLMGTLADKTPLVTAGSFPYACAKSKKRLSTHYQSKRKLYAQKLPDFWDHDLRKLFGPEPYNAQSPKAHLFLLSRREALLEATVAWSSMPKYTVSNLLKAITVRAKALGLFVNKPVEQSALQVATYLTGLIFNYNYTGKYKGHSR